MFDMEEENVLEDISDGRKPFPRAIMFKWKSFWRSV
jgi:hypothetical protein